MSHLHDQGYSTRCITVPVINPDIPRRRSMPGKIGPWPIKRSLSDTDGWTSWSGACTERLSPNSCSPNLGHVLKKIDEDCATIDVLVTRERAITSTSDIEKSSVKAVLGDKQHDDRVLSAKIDKTFTNLMLFLFSTSSVVLSIWPPLTSWILVTKHWDKVTVKDEAPPVVLLGLILATPFILFAMTACIYLYVLAEQKQKRTVGRRRHAMSLVTFMGVLSAGCLNFWIFVWFLPLTKDGSARDR